VSTPEPKAWWRSVTIVALLVTVIGAALAIVGLVAHAQDVVATGVAVVSAGASVALKGRSAATQPIRWTKQAVTVETADGVEVSGTIRRGEG
jgi:hypothetical protein